MTETKPTRKDIGGVWVRETKTGVTYMTLQLEGASYVAFKNKYKEEGSNRPDYRIFRSEHASIEKKSAIQVNHESAVDKMVAQTFVEEDIPF